MEQKELLADMAKRSGIDLIGVVDLDLFSKFKQKALKLGDVDIAFFNGKFEDRFDLKKAWAFTRSVISFAVSYNTSTNYVSKHGYVRISKASYGEDYHKVLKNKAEAAMQLFTKYAPCNYKIYVDTGVLSDRALAYCAGLGFYGKNNFIINEKYGSFIFLGHILLDIPLKASVTPIQQKCGECEKCLNACPYNAYLLKVIDYKKCISYLNQKGLFYDKTDYIYGCDICQNACPFNSCAPKDIHSEFYCSPQNVNPKAAEFIEMDKEEFDRRYSNSALYWRGQKTLTKNCILIKEREKTER